MKCYAGKQGIVGRSDSHLQSMWRKSKNIRIGSVGFEPLITLTEMWDEETPCLIMVKSLA